MNADKTKAQFPKGQRVVFIAMGVPDPYTKLVSGMQGTVAFVDDTATVHVDWDNGAKLGMLVLDGDRIERVSGPFFDTDGNPVLTVGLVQDLAKAADGPTGFISLIADTLGMDTQRLIDLVRGEV